jgi:hypothetical protein
MSIAILEIEEALLTRGFDGSDMAWFIANDPLVYFNRNTRDTPKLMLEMPKPIPAPLVKSPRLMADRAVPVITPARCKPRNSLSML